jgi:hypothetical protein
MTNDKSIVDVLAQLQRHLGADTFEVLDHWDADLFAVGIARAETPQRLVYILTYGLPEGRYTVELELPPEPGSDDEYESSGWHENLAFGELAAIAAKHLGLGR